MQEHKNTAVESEPAGFPWKQVIGLILSLALTFLALWIAVGLSLPVHVTLTLIVGLAVIQALIQLFMFMHVLEGTDTSHQILGLIFGIFVAFAMVAGTLWIMYFTL
ncbi:cytochrome aa3 quinol oxidase subunit IV [Sporolactobacillus sp. THM7-4]|nr:cytochrome aa3 quinol oxidase subunit IV [Sporolactobacillus sp. THM7-4]